MSRRITLELDELDVRLLLSDIKLAAITRRAGRKLFGVVAPQTLAEQFPDTPHADDRSRNLIERLNKVLG